MAELVLQVLVAPLLEVIFDKLSNPILKEFGLLSDVKKDLDKLLSNVSAIRSVLHDAEVKQIKDASTRDWLTKLKDALYEADDILDECATTQELDDDDDDDDDVSGSKQVCDFLTCFNCKLNSRNNIASRIKAIRQKFYDIAVERANYHLVERVGESGGWIEEFDQDRETSSSVTEPQIHGRDKAKEMIIETLLHHANDPQQDGLFVYPIVGIGGIGKTTLAQLVYNDGKVEGNFVTKIWVCVSDDFSVKKLVRKIIACLSKKNCELENLEPLQTHLKELLSGKKFLLVLDDVWNDKSDLWYKLRSALTCGADGSSIIVTTRESRVALIMGTHPGSDVTPLTEEHCWFLFKGHAFGVGNEDIGNFEVVGKQIVKKCRGVPLAAKALGDSLCFVENVDVWNSVRDSEIWELDNDGGIIASLRLSYNRLSLRLKQCFAYCSIFPKDCQMEKLKLILLWLANGFIQSNGTMELEDIGSQIFDELASKSFFQDVRKDKYGIPQYCKMHDLMHDLASSVMVNECSILEEGDDQVANVSKNTRHLSLPFGYLTPVTILHSLSKSCPFLRTCLISNRTPKAFVYENLHCLRALDMGEANILDELVPLEKMKHLRYLKLRVFPNFMCSLKVPNLQTLILANSPHVLPDFLLNAINLRHLDISYYRFSVLADWFGQLINLRHLSMENSEKLIELSDGIGQLINLRYMNISRCGKLTHLPDGIGRLINLRHLDISYCIKLTTLPDGIGQLINLRHLDMYSCQSLTQLPKDIGQLINLRYFNILRCNKLAEFPVGEQMHFLQTLPWFVVGDQASIQTLQGLNQLRDKLQIRGLEQVQDAREAKEANLAAKKNLTSLSLIWQQNNSNNSDNEAAEVLDCLEPPLSLNLKLLIKGYGGSCFPSWIKLLQSLAEIELQGCNKCEQLPPLGQLHVLKVLTIKGMDSLKCIGNEFYSEGGKSEMEGFFFRSLERLVFENMPNLETWDQYHVNLLMREERRQTFTFPCLKVLALSGCPKLGLLPFLILPCLQQLHVLNCEKVVVRSLPSLTFLKLAGQLSFSEVEGVSSFQNLDALETLEIEKSQLISLPREGLAKLSSLKSLRIVICNGLNSLPAMGIIQEGLTRSSLVTLLLQWCVGLTSLTQGLQYLSALEDLNVRFCGQLEFSIGDFEHLINIRIIRLEGLPNLAFLPELQHLSRLQTLEVSYCEKLMVLPQGLKYLSSLEDLNIAYCEQLALSNGDFDHLIKIQTLKFKELPKVTFLPKLHHLSRLQYLEVSYCKELKDLPQGIQHLTSLCDLVINKCHADLHVRCERHRGQYWSNIAHIPHLRISE